MFWTPDLLFLQKKNYKNASETAMSLISSESLGLENQLSLLPSVASAKADTKKTSSGLIWLKCLCEVLFMLYSQLVREFNRVYDCHWSFNFKTIRSFEEKKTVLLDWTKVRLHCFDTKKSLRGVGEFIIWEKVWSNDLFSDFSVQLP